MSDTDTDVSDENTDPSKSKRTFFSIQLTVRREERNTHCVYVEDRHGKSTTSDVVSGRKSGTGEIGRTMTSML